MPLLTLRRQHSLHSPRLIGWNNVALIVNETTLIPVYPVDGDRIRWSDIGYLSSTPSWYWWSSGTVRTDLVAVFRKGRRARTATDWWFWVWDGERWRCLVWDDLSTDDRLKVVGNFLRFFKRDGSVVPWGKEYETMVALDGL